MELSKIEEKDKSIDEMVDERQKLLGMREDNFVLDSRLGAFFIPHADFKIFFDCDLKERAKRIFMHKRKDEAGDIETIQKAIKDREESEHSRFLKFYNFDYKDYSSYDFLVDTTNLKEAQTTELILKKIKQLEELRKKPLTENKDESEEKEEEISEEN
jgi:CMP/dCMP kinase